MNKKLIILCVSCAVILIAAPIAGYYIPKSTEAVNRSLNSLHKKDSAYIEAKLANDKASSKAGELSTQLDESKKNLEEAQLSQENLDKISEKNAELQREKEQLQSEVKQKRATLDNVEVSVSSYANRIITWSSGDYTVGKDIAEGTYTITGSGSIAIARNGKSVANKLLKSEGDGFTLNKDDKIHIDGTARLTPQ